MNAKTVAQAVMDDSILWREIVYGPEETTEYVSLEALRSCIEERAAPLDAEIERLQAALATREAQLRLVLIVAYNTTVNANGGIGVGDKAADAMLARLNAVLMEPLPAWTRGDEVVALPALA